MIAEDDETWARKLLLSLVPMAQEKLHLPVRFYPKKLNALALSRKFSS
jgi:hypothetical protein